MAKPNLAPSNQTVGFMIFSSMMVLILTTVVLSLFLNRFKIEDGAETAPTRRIQDLVSLLQQAESKRTRLESEVSTLRKKLVTLEKGATPGDSVSRDPEIKKLYRLAGLTPVTGEGLVIRLEDSKTPPAAAKGEHVDPNSGKLQADDLLKLVNELKTGGAKAISINDQRLVVTSEIVPSGQMISVNQTRLTQPVIVKVIGDADMLMTTLKFRGGILEYLDFFNVNVSVEKKPSVTVPAYKGTL